MTSKAPGKMVLSGAYAVLRGAPAVVTAVNRYAFADGRRAPQFATIEVTAALEVLKAAGHTVPFAPPWFDAAALREDGRKLGLGSSAAILVACLWEVVGRIPGFGGRSSLTLREAIFDFALAAHRAAQGGGSGIDVAASTFGGTLVARMAREELFLEATPLPSDVTFESWAMPTSASTSEFVGSVLALADAEPAVFDRSFGAQTAASHAAADALRKEDGRAFVQALRTQHQALKVLGEDARVPIVLPSVQAMHRLLPQTSCFLPSGAGGGDVSLYVGPQPSDNEFRREAARHGLHLLDLMPDAAGSGPSQP